MEQYFENKIAWINQHIDKCDEVIKGKRVSEAKALQRMLLSIFSPELPQMGANLDKGNLKTGEIDYLNNIEILKGILSNYILNLRSGLYKPFQKNAERNLQQTATQSTENKVCVTITQTAEIINQLPNTALASDEKEVLNGKLMAIETAADKPTRWEKAKDTLKWIAEKGIEVGIAALPYIVEALKK